MKKILFILFSYIFLFADSIAVGYEGSPDYNLIQKCIVNTSLRIKQTNGDLANLRLILKDPSTQMGVVQEDILADFVTQNPSFKEKLKILTPLYPAPLLLIVPQKSDIETFKDINGKRVIVDIEGSGDYYTFLKLQESRLINPEIFNMKKNQAITYLKKGKADALFYIGDIKDVAGLYPFYKFIPIMQPGYKYKSFLLDKNSSLTTSYVIKYVVTQKAKENRYSKSNFLIFLENLLDYEGRDYLCSFDETTPVPKEDFIYFACSQHRRTTTPIKKTHITRKRTITTALYYDNLEDIILYPLALRNRDFEGYGTSYMVEKVKFENAVRLMKKELATDASTKIIIISKGPEQSAMSNMYFIYNRLKRAKIPRSALIKKVVPTPCQQECFLQTTITFKTLE